ncbi:VOC family protein [Peptococcaceae bacterium 1198_IL3148]
MSQSYKFVHACVRVLDVEKSIKFYQEALGMEISRRRDFPEYQFSLVYLKFPGEDFELELTYNYDRQQPYTLGDGYSHMAVTVNDLSASYNRHKNAGYTVSEIKQLSGEATGGYYFLTDPDGYRTEIIQR